MTGKALVATCAAGHTLWAALAEPQFEKRAEELREQGRVIDLLYIDHIPPVSGCTCKRAKKRKGRRS